VKYFYDHWNDDDDDIRTWWSGHSSKVLEFRIHSFLF
jgi:hypothetical protein